MKWNANVNLLIHVNEIVTDELKYRRSVNLVKHGTFDQLVLGSMESTLIAVTTARDGEKISVIDLSVKSCARHDSKVTWLASYLLKFMGTFIYCLI